VWDSEDSLGGTFGPDGDILFATAVGYPTLLAHDGARHAIVPGFHLGATVDADPNGQPNVSADGDDHDGQDDEDGVELQGTLVAGQVAWFEVTVTGASIHGAYLDAWIDLDRNGDWNGPDEHVLVSHPVSDGQNLLSFAVPHTAAGATYARFRLSSAGGLSPTGVALDGEVEDYRVEIVEPLGPIDFLQRSSMHLPADFSMFTFTATRDAALTILEPREGDTPEVVFSLYDAELNWLADSEAVASYEWLDWDTGVTAGAQYYLTMLVLDDTASIDLCLANLVRRTDSTVSVFGTGVADQFDFDASAGFHVAVNGVPYDYAAGQVNQVAFDGLGGKDIATLTCSGGDESAVLYPDRGTIKGPGYFVTLTSIEHKTVGAGDGTKDIVKISGSNYDDTFTASPAEGVVTSPGCFSRAIGFDNLSTHARVGNDKAFLSGSDGADTFVGRPICSNLSGVGFYLGAQEFDEITVQGRPGEGDLAYLTDSDGDETVVADPQQTTMTGATFKYVATGFDKIYASARSGGTDTAELTDGPSSDTFDAYPDYATLSGPGFWLQAKYFDEVKAYGTTGGRDTANFFDSTGDDTFEARLAETKMVTPKADNYAYGFLVANAYGYNGGADTAELDDSEWDDSLDATTTSIKLASNNAYLQYLYEVLAFDSVTAKSTTGRDTKNIAPGVENLMLVGAWE